MVFAHPMHAIVDRRTFPEIHIARFFSLKSTSDMKTITLQNQILGDPPCLTNRFSNLKCLVSISGTVHAKMHSSEKGGGACYCKI